MAFVFSHTEYCDMHFVYGFCDGNACPAVEEYRRHFPARQFHIRVYFHVFRQCMKRVVFLVSVCSLKGKRYLTLTYVRTFLREVQNFPLGRFAFHISVLHIQVWQTVHEEYLHPYHVQRVQHLEPRDLAHCVDLCNWIKAHPQPFYS